MTLAALLPLHLGLDTLLHCLIPARLSTLFTYLPTQFLYPLGSSYCFVSVLPVNALLFASATRS
jgi:hypothetical protein